MSNPASIENIKFAMVSLEEAATALSEAINREAGRFYPFQAVVEAIAKQRSELSGYLISATALAYVVLVECDPKGSCRSVNLFSVSKELPRIVVGRSRLTFQVKSSEEGVIILSRGSRGMKYNLLINGELYKPNASASLRAFFTYEEAFRWCKENSSEEVFVDYCDAMDTPQIIPIHWD